MIAYLLGHPVAHSLSPLMQNAAFHATGLPHRYEVWDVALSDLKSAVTRLRDGDVLGANVTVPHKESVLPYLDSFGVQARRAGAVNTIARTDSRLVGWNTDMTGFTASLVEAELDVRDKRVLLLGAGGAARAVLVVLHDGGAHVDIANRTPERAERLAEVGGTVVDWPAPEEIGRYDVVINATPLGLKGEDPLAGAPLAERLTVIDLIPAADPTALVRRARAAGCRVIDGMPMLLHQGAASFKIWTGLDAPLAVMRDALSTRSHT